MNKVERSRTGSFGKFFRRGSSDDRDKKGDTDSANNSPRASIKIPNPDPKSPDSKVDVKTSSPSNSHIQTTQTTSTQQSPSHSHVQTTPIPSQQQQPQIANPPSPSHIRTAPEPAQQQSQAPVSNPSQSDIQTTTSNPVLEQQPQQSGNHSKVTTASTNATPPSISSNSDRVYTLADGTKVDIYEFKRKMIEQYEKQMKENEELLKKRREMGIQPVASTLPPSQTAITVASLPNRSKSATTTAVLSKGSKMAPKSIENQEIQVKGVISESRVMVLSTQKTRFFGVF